MPGGVAALQVSPTRLKTFIDCPFKFKQKYILKVPPSDTVPPYVFDIGSCVHKLGEHYTLKKENERNLKTDITVKKMMKEFKLQNSYFNTIKEQYLNLKTFLTPILKDENVKRIKKESKINPYFYPKCFFYGKADLIVYYEDGRGLIVDYKSSKDNKGDHSLQLGIYAYSLAKEDKIRSDQIRAGVYYTRYNEFSYINYDKQKIKEILTKAYALIEESNNTKEYKRKINQYCGTCDYRTICNQK